MSEAAPPMTLSLGDVLSRPMPGVARIVLEHHRGQRFRAAAIFELSFGLLCFACVLPIFFAAALSGNLDVELPTLSGRFYHRWHELRVTLLDASGKVLATVAHIPAAQADGEAVVAAVLAAAQRERLTVVEVLSGNLRETLEIWYGGRPLLAHPDEAVEAQSTALLRQLGYDVRADGEELRIVEENPRTHPALAMLLLVLIAPFTPLLLLVPSGLRPFRLLSQDIRGAPPARKVLVVRAESLCMHWERGVDRWNETVLDGRDLCGISFAPSLGYDRDVTRSPATLRLIGRARTTTYPITRAADAGRALRDLLVASTLRLRRAKPELGLLGAGPVPAHCPFCAALYLMEPGSRCPSCGAHTGAALQG